MIRHSTIATLVLLASQAAFAMPRSPQAMQPLQPGLPEISIRIDVHNLTGASDEGKLDEAQMRSRVELANDVWNQCSIEFLPRSYDNLSAQKLNVPFEPKGQDDLSRIAEAINPGWDFHGGLPLIFAGVWTFNDGGWVLTGLGWVFYNGPKITKIGAMIDEHHLFQPTAGPIIAHELGHTLTLPHNNIDGNLMGPNGTGKITVDQCNQARRFAEFALRDFFAP